MREDPWCLDDLYHDMPVALINECRRLISLSKLCSRRCTVYTFEMTPVLEVFEKDRPPPSNRLENQQSVPELTRYHEWILCSMGIA